ncbi:nucleotidyltransferase domain-containing protein [bacterium CPR1]|nr:nucleotidyltransferase domain-containing protein [bacterium CPR1]
MGFVRDGVREVEPQLKGYLQVLKRKLPVRAAVVFGSRARNDHWRDSDIDLLVVSEAFEGMPRSLRIDFLLDEWQDVPALEPFGCTPAELAGPGGLMLWDALHQGRPIFDDGTWREARAQFQRRIERGELTPTAGGWRERLSDSSH